MFNPNTMASLQPMIKPNLTDISNPQPRTESSTTVSAVSNLVSTSEIQKCFALLEEGKGKVITNQTDIVFLLGMTGSGKTTLVKFLATNNDNLLAEEVSENIGEYVINDPDQKISSSTILSQTIFPELYVDPETQTAFYDGPGFSDTRGMGVDIAGAYFVRKVISESKKIRFILTINYTSVRRGMDRGDFLELLKHVLHLVKNVDPYLESFALVVTKVENQMMKKDGELVMVPDENVLEYVAKFLLDFKANIPKVAHGAMAENMAKLVDVLLHKTNSSYEKITLFRRPDEAGPLSKISLLQDSKTTIKKVIRDNLKSANVNKDDFGFAISEESKNKLHDMVTVINENIANAIREACKSKILIYEKKTAELTDVYQAYNILKADFEKLRDWSANKSDDVSLQDFVGDLFAVSQPMKAPFSEEEKNLILSQGEYVSFIETVNGKKFKGSASSWKMGLQSYLTYFKESTSWYKFLTVWHTVLSSYAVQKNQNDFSRLLEHQITDLYDEEFVKLLTFCKSLTGELNNFQSVVMNPVKSEQLYRILESTLKPNIKATYDEKSNSLVVRGKFVKLSDHVKTHKNLQKAKFVSVFAVDKLFIDVDFRRLNDNLQTLSLAAPTWEVIGDVQIKLDGEKGCCNPNHRAQDGDWYWKKGRDGYPGAPGKSAANFIGLVDFVVNGEHLKITADGGQGADGQDGGKGFDGHNGDSPISKNLWGCSGSDFNRFSSQQLGGFFRKVYCVYGESGGNGGDGGNGGVGGYGGHPGKIVFPAKQPLNIRFEANEGAAGRSGSGGEGGEGGKAGRSWNHQKMMWWWREASCSRSQRLADEYGDCADTDFLRNGSRGNRGIAGAHWHGVQVPEFTDLADAVATANEYREFLQHEANNDKITRLSKMDFLNKLDDLVKSKLGKTVRPHFLRLKRMAKLPSKRVKRQGPLENERPKWINNDCFQVPQWPVTDKIGHAQRPHTTTDVTLTSIPLTDTLLLTDLLVRKLNQTRPDYLQSCTVDYKEVRGCAIHILSIFDKILANIYGAKEAESISMDMDPIALMEKLEKGIINGSPENISKILLDSFDNESPEHKEELRRQLITDLELESS